MTQQTMFLKNTETFAESLARCGVKFHFAYPITPATDVMKRMAVILPQYGDENDALAVQQVQAMFPERRVVGVQTREVAFGGGNIHCITQQQPAPQHR